MNEGESIAAGERVKLFLKDDAIVGALKGLAVRYYEEFKAAKTPAERETAWAKSRVLDDFGVALDAVQSNAQHAAHERDQREKREEVARQQRERGSRK